MDELHDILDCIRKYDPNTPLEEKGRYFEIIQRDLKKIPITPEERLMFALPNDQWQKVMNQPMCDIDATFFGFIHTYDALSKIIPKEFTVIDLGCCFNAQSFYFTEHREYIAVDISDCIKFKPDNCTIYNKSISEFIERDISKFDLKTTFAICNYVSDSMAELVRKSFMHVYTFYPHSKITHYGKSQNWPD